MPATTTIRTIFSHAGAGRLADLLALWRQRAEGRRRLARMSDRDLRDLGCAPAQAEFELAKRFWRE